VAENSHLQKARAHVGALIKERKPEGVRYHDFNRAESVVKTCQAIGTASNLDEESFEVLSLAAWFHDVGYVEGIEGHEERSVEMANLFLRQNGYPKRKIAQVAGCIRFHNLLLEMCIPCETQTTSGCFYYGNSTGSSDWHPYA
jgi:predicted metal-dependent HD superfamily phosphohydrolase